MTIVRTYNQSGDVAINDAPAQIVRVFEGASGTNGTNGTDGQDGVDGVVQSIVAGTNVAVDSTDPANPIVSATGGSGAVDSVNGQTGTVVLGASDVSADPAGSAATAQSTAEGYTDTSIASEVTRADAAYDATGAAATAQSTAEAYTDTAVSSLVPNTRTVAGHALSANVTISAADVSAVPTTRTVNAKALSADVTLTASDVSAVPTTRTVAGHALSADVTLVKGDVGLGSVDNTADTSKPVSTAQQTALDLKANLASPTLTGTPAAPTATGGTNTTQLATTAFVASAVSPLAPLASPALTGNPTAPTATAGDNDTSIATTAFVTNAVAKQPEAFVFALGDETTAITTGTKVTWRIPFAFTLTQIRASLTTASSSGVPAFDVKKNGTSVFSTTLTIDATEKTSQTAATAAVLSTTALSDDDELTFIVSTAGTAAAGVKITLIGTRA